METHHAPLNFSFFYYSCMAHELKYYSPPKRFSTEAQVKSKIQFEWEMIKDDDDRRSDFSTLSNELLRFHHSLSSNEQHTGVISTERTLRSKVDDDKC